MAVVDLDRICKYYDGTEAPAVDDVTLTVADGEFMVLLGPSGCGKSTTLRMVAGLETISSGVLSIDGQVMNPVPAKDRDIAMVFQSYALYPHMTVKDNLAFGLRRRRVPRQDIERRVTEVATMLGLSDLLRRKPFALSGGQRQRVALGRAIVRDPKVFLFDEPLSNLDAALRVSTRNELVRLHQRLGATMIYVTHDQVEAMTMGSRICIMQDGRVVQIGVPLDVYRRPANTFVARFLGSPPMNLLPVTLTRGDSGFAARIDEADIPLPGHVPDTIAAHVDGPVLLGIRPEDVYESPPGNATLGSARLHARVQGVEPLGAETLVALELDGAELTARVGRDSRCKVGDNIDVHLDLAAVQLFDAGSGGALSTVPDDGS